MLTRNGRPPPIKNQKVCPNIISRSSLGPPFAIATLNCLTKAAIDLQQSLQ